MKSAQIDDLSQRIVACLKADHLEQASDILLPLLHDRTPFRTLDRIGARIGTEPLPVLDPLLDDLAQSRLEGAWVVIGSSLAIQIPSTLTHVVRRCRHFIVLADAWYAATILGERVPGKALVTHFSEGLEQIKPWRHDANRWVRRALGHAAHVWAKRTRELSTTPEEAIILLEFFEPLLVEQDTDALKGIGWGLKTMGKTYPAQVADWLQKIVIEQKRPCRPYLLRKACTHLPEHVRLGLMVKRPT